MKNPFKRHACPDKKKIDNLQTELDATNFVHATLKAQHEIAEKFIVDLNKENKFLKEKIKYYDTRDDYA